MVQHILLVLYRRNKTFTLLNFWIVQKAKIIKEIRFTFTEAKIEVQIPLRNDKVKIIHNKTADLKQIRTSDMLYASYVTLSHIFFYKIFFIQVNSV